MVLRTQRNTCSGYYCNWYKMDTLGTITDSLLLISSEPGKIIFDSQDNITISYGQIYPPNSNYYDSIKAGFRRYDYSMNHCGILGQPHLSGLISSISINRAILYVYGDRFGFADNNQSARPARIDTSELYAG